MILKYQNIIGRDIQKACNNWFISTFKDSLSKLYEDDKINEHEGCKSFQNLSPLILLAN
jgi:hypothetical protein